MKIEEAVPALKALAAAEVGLHRDPLQKYVEGHCPCKAIHLRTCSQASGLERKVIRLAVLKKNWTCTWKRRAGGKLEPTSTCALPPSPPTRRTFKSEWPLLLSCLPDLTKMSFQSALTWYHAETLENIVAASPSGSSAKSPRSTPWKLGACAHHFKPYITSKGKQNQSYSNI